MCRADLDALEAAADKLVKKADKTAVEAAAENPAINTTITETTEQLSISFWDLFMGGGWLMWVLVALAAVMHVPRKTKVSITAAEGTEILVQQTDNERDFEPVFYTPEMCLYQEFGKGQWGGTGHRICSTVFDYDNATYSNMVLGEVFNQPGKWSSYPPHHHPQPEVYYYQFDKPQGFGACFVGENVYKSVHGSASYITDGNDHHQVVASGYEMCYVWMIRHLENDPWIKTRIDDPDHKWLLDV